MSNIDQHSCSPVQTQRGLTLVEILVALMISAFLIAGVIQLFIGSKQTYRGHDALSRIQENGRFVMDKMASDIRMAGYELPSSIPPPPPCTSFPAVPTTPPITPLTIPNSSSIQVQWFDPRPLPNTPLPNGCDPNPHPASRCNPASGVCFRNYSVICNGGGVPPCTGGGDNDFGDLILSSETSGGNQELIEGVANMRITNRVDSVRIDLLLVSMNRFLATQSQTVTFPPDNTGVPYTAPDNRLVQIFSTTVAIRNR
ncbi:MAG: prepilin-type N-terminal cleavage/methylation domain-containing protein [Candidatus Contendobacter sp.]|nr:prepilin-type N-terminal cleavage/methylation domain-containing protein [Candidatus Contendobacter sp.]